MDDVSKSKIGIRIIKTLFPCFNFFPFNFNALETIMDKLSFNSNIFKKY